MNTDQLDYRALQAAAKDRGIPANQTEEALRAALDAHDDDANPPAPASEAAGPNEAATGEVSPADRAKTVDDPDASGDAGTTAERYPDDAPAQLGPEMPQSEAERAAHAASAAAAEVAGQLSGTPDEVLAPAEQRYTPEEALREASNRATNWSTHHRQQD